MRANDMEMLYALRFFETFFESPFEWVRLIPVLETPEDMTGFRLRYDRRPPTSEEPDPNNQEALKPDNQGGSASNNPGKLNNPKKSKITNRVKLQPNNPEAQRFLRLVSGVPDPLERIYPEYERLFYGTDASIRIPLWASACRTNGSVILDETTLGFVLRCHAWGFDPPRPDGNPPDFIGSQLAFLAYLYGCASHTRAAGRDDKKYLDAAAALRADFLQDTVAVMADAALSHCNEPIIAGFLQLLAAFAERFEPPFVLDPTAGISESDSEPPFVLDPMAGISEIDSEPPFVLEPMAGISESDFEPSFAASQATAALTDNSEPSFAAKSETGCPNDTDPPCERKIEPDLSILTGIIPETAACFTAMRDGPSPPIKTPPEKTVLTAGINNCGGRCVLRARARAGCVLEIDTDRSNRIPQLRACLKGRAYRRTFFSTERLRYPMKRVGKRGEGRFTRISWDEAISLLVSEWVRIRDAFGPLSRYILMGTGNEAVLRGDHFLSRLLNLDGGYLRQYNSYSAACVHEISPYIYGDLMGGHSIDDLLNTKLLILWGNNPAETFFGTERVQTLTELKQRGVRIIVIDPRESDSAVAFADEWIGIRPSTDGAMANAMAWVLLTENLLDRDFLNRYALGFDAAHMPTDVPASESCSAWLLGEKDGIPKTPEWAEEICGVPAQTIRRLARMYAAAKPACLLPGLGLQRTGNGEQTVRALAMLCAMTGNVGIPGGSSGADFGVGGQAFVEFPQLNEMEENPAAISCFMWGRAIDDGPGMRVEPDGLRGVDRLTHGIKMLFCLASNILINQHSNINETRRILSDESKCEFIVCSDIFMTSSARWADLVLPAAAVFENDNFTHSWAGLGYYLLCNNKVINPPFECRFEWDWMRELACALGYGEAFMEGKPELAQWQDALYKRLKEMEPELPSLEAFKAAGGYSYAMPRSYVAYSEQRRDPDAYPFATPSGKIELYSARIAAMGDPASRPAIPRYVPAVEGFEDALREKYPLQLIGWHTKRRSHSIHDNNPWLEEAEPQRLWINPKDAAVRSIADGDMIRVFNERGVCRLPAFLTDRVISGVVAMPQGAWYTPDASGMDVRGCINTLTSTHAPTPYAKGNPQHTNLVEVEKAGTLVK